jgi:hypothetical protein
MSQVLKATLEQVVQQWSALLAARIYETSGLDPVYLTSRIPTITAKLAKPIPEMMTAGIRLLKKHQPANLVQMQKSSAAVVREFTGHPLFPHAFSAMVRATHAAFLTPIKEEATKGKAGHSEEVVSEREQLCCEIFEFLSALLTSSAQRGDVEIEQVGSDVVSHVFAFIDNGQPERVRLSACQILTAVSASPQRWTDIFNLFWARFAKLKKDDEFRNFTIWIDGIADLKLSLASPRPAISNGSLTFFQKFNEYSKKMERTVLRERFLDLIISYVTQISAEPESSRHQDYFKQLQTIWTTVHKWSKNDKHAKFCLIFLQNLLAHSSPQFCSAHALVFIEQLAKTVKSQPNDPQLLRCYTQWIDCLPDRFLKDKRTEFERVVTTVILPWFFPERDEGRIRVRYPAAEFRSIVVSVLAGIGNQKIDFLADICRIGFAPVERIDTRVHLIRLVYIQAITKLGEINRNTRGCE